MKWTKKNGAQVAQSDGYEVEIVKSRGIYWATCYEVRGSVRLKKFAFPPKRSIKALKELVAGNALFSQGTPVRKESKPQSEPEAMELQWWQR